MMARDAGITVTNAQIESAPSTETNQIIQKVAPSFNFPRPTLSDGTDSVRPATLRGLGPDQVLVMVNGKRRHVAALVNVNGTVGRGSAGVDLNAIPASAIDSVEILRDGAAAQYGSDAIAGVLNLVLKSDAQPLKLEVKGGSTTHGDGEMLDSNLSGGWNVGRGCRPTSGGGRRPVQGLSDFFQQHLGGERLDHVSIGALLLRPEYIALRTLGTHEHYRDPSEFLVALQFAAGLEAVAAGHDHIHQDQIRPLDFHRLLQTQRIIDGDRPVAGFAKHRHHPSDLGLRVIHDQYLRQSASLRRWLSAVRNAIGEPL